MEELLNFIIFIGSLYALGLIGQRVLSWWFYRQ
jgi:hypothetical protein